jgi:hypothetical protein
MNRVFVLAVLIGWAAGSAEASAPEEAHALQAQAVQVRASQTQNVETEPVTCWWRTTATSVRVGEPFGVILTCSLLQTEAARVIADESRLEPSVVQLPPFEVVEGRRAKDLSTAGRRFVQFEYRLRTIAENVFASEVALPALEISYRVESRVAGGDSLAGRDRTYALPPLMIRVLSLVPDNVDDIREAPVATFAEIHAAASRGTMFRVGGGVMLGVGGLVLALALAGVLRGRRAPLPLSHRTLSTAAILGGVRRELATVTDSVRASGWTSDLVGRALAAARIVAAHATGRPVMQRVTSEGPPPSSGELVLSGRAGRSTVVSAAVAATEDDELRDTLGRLTMAHYGRTPDIDERLDEVVETVSRRIDRLIAERPWTEKLWPR